MEEFIRHVAEWLRQIVELIGLIVVALGVGFAVCGALKTWMSRGDVNFTQVRLTLARYLALALEFQLAADILSTAIAPGWDEIGKLGAIAVIRTGLNYFLMREMEAHSEEAAKEIAPQSQAT